VIDHPVTFLRLSCPVKKAIDIEIHVEYSLFHRRLLFGNDWNLGFVEINPLSPRQDRKEADLLAKREGIMFAN